MILTDAFGAEGGIGEFNRHLISTIASRGDTLDVVSISYARALDGPPPGVRWIPLPRQKIRFSLGALRVATGGFFDVVICGHVNLSPLVVLAKGIGFRRRMWTVTHGIEVWNPPSRIRRLAFDRSDLVTAVSGYTRDKISRWTKVPTDRIAILYNTVDENRFTPGGQPRGLVDRYGLAGRKVLLSVGRLSAMERYKGQDLVIAALPLVARVVPEVTYLVVGDGDDRPRLESLARQHRVADRVVFAGRVPSEELADHYRVADLFVLPSRGEGFGIVYLEAACCGLGSVARRDDAGGEVVDRLGGLVVETDKPEDLAGTIVRGLSGGSNRESARRLAIEQFGLPVFHRTVGDLLRRLETQR
jgi:glycosyltransferase involved in cell wall biosynthesis